MPEAAIAARLSSGSPPRASCPCSPWQPGGPVWYSAWAWLQVVSARAAAHRPSAGVIVRRWRHRQAVSRSGCAAACMWGVGPPCSGGLSGAGAPLAFARATRRLGGVWRALLSIGRGGGGGVRRRLSCSPYVPNCPKWRLARSRAPRAVPERSPASHRPPVSWAMPDNRWLGGGGK